MSSQPPNDPDPLRKNGSELVQLAAKVVSSIGTPNQVAWPFPKQDLNRIAFSEGPVFYPVWTCLPDEFSLHVKKSSKCGREWLEKDGWKSLYDILLGAALSPSSTDNFRFPTILDFYNLYTSKRALPDQLALQLIQAIERSNATSPPLRAIVQCNKEDLLNQAAASTERWRNNAPLSPLDGCFVSIKENFAVKGYETRQGTSFLCRDQPSTYDAELVHKLKKLGAIIIGLTNMHEMGWDISGINPFSGPARNPYHLWRSAGGSSAGGSASSVASGLAVVSLGGDAGGSVRIPSAYCGLYGLKPSCGRLSLGPDGASLSMATKGIHAGSVGDLAVTYLAIAGTSTADPLTSTAPPPHIDALLDPSRNYVAAYDPSVWTTGCTHSGINRICQSFLHDVLGKLLDFTIKEITIPDYLLIRRGQATAAISEMTSSICNLRPPGQPDADPWKLVSPQLAYEMGSWLGTFNARDYLQALKMRARGMRKMDELFNGEGIDVIVSPTTGNVGYPIHKGDEINGASAPANSAAGLAFTGPYNFLGMPALSIPIGYLSAEDTDDPSEVGMPVGLQVAGRWWTEDVLLGVAGRVERVVGERGGWRRPGAWHGGWVDLDLA